MPSGGGYSIKAGKTYTGIDRVALAYLRHALSLPDSRYLLRTRFGFLLLGQEAGAAIERSGYADHGSALSALRALRVDRSSRAGLPRMLRRCFPGGAQWVNVGHTNLDPWTLRAIGRAGLRRIVMIHDTIPLDLPHMQRLSQAERFARMLDAVTSYADGIVANSETTARDIRRHTKRDQPPIVVAPLGVDSVAAGGEWPAALDRTRPIFVALSTIEPRKNHALLLDVWASLPEPRPQLAIIGKRGWLNREVFARLDAHPDGVVELPGLSNAQVTQVLSESRALLFPSLAEGYGLPPIEAAALGVPVIATPLPVLKETLGETPVYVPAQADYEWRSEVMRLARAGSPLRLPPVIPPTWSAHFATVFKTPW